MILHPQALHNLFFSRNYDWKSFVIALVASLVGMLIMGSLEVLILQPLLGRCIPYFDKRNGPSIVLSQ